MILSLNKFVVIEYLMTVNLKCGQSRDFTIFKRRHEVARNMLYL